jgi:threonine-phosphate decarboxylase
MEQVHGGNIYEVAQRYRLRVDTIIDFSSNINPLGPSPRVLRALRSHLRWISRYPEMHARGLVGELARFHDLPEEAIVVGNGSTALIYRLPSALMVRNVLVLHPTFSEYERAFGLGGYQTDLLMREEASGFRPPWPRLFEALRRGYGAVMLCNPNNPTGDVIAKEELTEFVEEAARVGTVVIVDEAFMDFHEEATLKHEVLRRSNLIVLRSMTKCYALAGLRLGFLVASPPLAKRVREADEPWAVSAWHKSPAVKASRIGITCGARWH